jgi:hypothetical protein
LKFYYSYIKKKKIIPKNKILKKGFINNEKNVFDKLKWSAGNFDLYNLKKINTPKWKSFIDSINKYGGQYKHRWADFEIFSLYVMTYFKKGIYNFNFEKNGIYSPNFQNSAETIYSDSIINIQVMNNMLKKLGLDKPPADVTENAIDYWLNKLRKSAGTNETELKKINLIANNTALINMIKHIYVKANNPGLSVGTREYDLEFSKLSKLICLNSEWDTAKTIPSYFESIFSFK